MRCRRPGLGLLLSAWTSNGGSPCSPRRHSSCCRPPPTRSAACCWARARQWTAPSQCPVTALRPHPDSPSGAAAQPAAQPQLQLQAPHWALQLRRSAASEAASQAHIFPQSQSPRRALAPVAAARSPASSRCELCCSTVLPSFAATAADPTSPRFMLCALLLLPLQPSSSLNQAFSLLPCSPSPGSPSPDDTLPFSPSQTPHHHVLSHLTRPPLPLSTTVPPLRCFPCE